MASEQVRHPVANVASSNAVQKILDQYPWADSGLKWKGTMVFKEQPGEDRSTLFDSAKKPGPNPQSGPSSSGKDAVTSDAPPPKAMPSASEADSQGDASSSDSQALHRLSQGKGWKLEGLRLQEDGYHPLQASASLMALPQRSPLRSPRGRIESSRKASSSTKAGSEGSFYSIPDQELSSEVAMDSHN